MLEQIKDNTEKIKNNKQLPYLVGNVVEVRSGDRWRSRACALFKFASTFISSDSRH